MNYEAEKIKNAINRPYMTDDVIHSILDISDIKTSETLVDKSIFFNLNIKKDRYIGHINYDKNLKK